MAAIDDGPDRQEDLRAGPTVVVAGGRDESITQPEWAPDGSLVFISDRTNWWNLYRLAAEQVAAAVAAGPGSSPPPSSELAPIEAEIGLPHWVFDQSRYALLRRRPHPRRLLP